MPTVILQIHCNGMYSIALLLSVMGIYLRKCFRLHPCI